VTALGRVASCLLTMVVVVGCAPTRIVEHRLYEDGKVAAPDRIIVHAFAATQADIPAGSALADDAARRGRSQTAGEIEVGRRLGAAVAKELVAEIQAMGLPAAQVTGERASRVGDIVIMGYFASVDTGGTVELGFGSGTAAQHTAIEGYLMTERGLRRLGSGALDSGDGKTPSVALSLEVVVASDTMGLIGGAVEVGGEASTSTTIERFGKRTAKAIAERLRVQFQKRGWVHSSGTESAVPFNARASANAAPWSWKIRFSDYAPQYVYQMGRLESPSPMI
jgi:hypothetical protein